MAYEKPARRLVDQRGRRSRTVYSKIKQMQMQSTYSLYVNAQKFIDVQGDHFHRLL